MADNGHESILHNQKNIISSNFSVYESLHFQTDQNFEGSVASSSSSNNPKSNRRRNRLCKKEHKVPVLSHVIEVKNKGNGKKAKRESIGGRIIALKQLLSQFGKTDAATVLHETTDYIKHLHGQAQTLYSSYLHDREEMESRIELKSRGLCLVPVACAINVTNSPSAVSLLPDMENNNGTGQ